MIPCVKFSENLSVCRVFFSPEICSLLGNGAYTPWHKVLRRSTDLTSLRDGMIVIHETIAVKNNCMVDMHAT